MFARRLTTKGREESAGETASRRKPAEGHFWQGLARLACLTLLLAACAKVSPSPTSDGSGLQNSVYGLTNLLADLRAVGRTAVDTGRPVDHGFAIVGVRALVDDVPVFVYGFVNTEAAQTAAAGVTIDEYSVTIVRTEGEVTYETHGDWVETPHVYLKGRLIVLTGSDPGVLEALSGVLGPPVLSLPGEIRSLELVGYLSAASIWTFDLHGNLAYIGQGSMLSIVQLTDPAKPRRVGYVVLHDGIRDVATASDPSTGRIYAYLALGAGGLAVVDVSDPAQPFVVRTHFEEGRVDAVAVDKTHLYVSAGALYVMDLSARADLAHPELAEFAEYRPVDAIGRPGQVIAVSGGRAYLLYHDDSARRGSLRIVDVSDPTAPSEIGVYRAGVPIRDGAIAGDYAYLLVGQGIPYLVGVDLSDPTRPVIGYADDAKTWVGQRLDVAEQTLYLASLPLRDSPGSLQILDVTNPVQPVALGLYSGVSAPVAEIIASDGRVVFAADASLIAVDVSVPNAPTVTGRYDSQKLPSVRRGLAAAENHVYIAAGTEGLWAVDVTDAADPRIVGSYNTGGHAWNVALWDGYAYVADEGSGLRVVDVRDPAHLVEVGALSPPGSSTFFGDVAIDVQPSSGRAYAYVADAFPGETGLCIVDISDPAAPRQVSRLLLGQGVQGDVRVYGLTVAGQLAYLGVGAAGLRIVDVSDPSVPVEVGALSVPGRANDLVVADRRAYLIDGDLRIVDVSDPSSPREIGFYDVPSLSPWPYVAVKGRRAFLTAQGTRVLDVSEPAAPVEIASSPLGQGAVTVDDGRIYVLGDGLYILRASAEAAPQPAATPTPECTDYTAEISLSTTDTQPYVGDVVTVTAMLTNRGCGLLGLPRYSLHAETRGDKPLFAAIPEAVVHSLPTPLPSPTPPFQLPDKAITSYATTPDGALWYAFDEYDDGGGTPPSSQHYGLYRSLDGQVSHLGVPGTIRALAVAPDGSLYIGAGRGVLRYEEGRLETLIDIERGQESFAWGFVPFDIAVSSSGDVWVGGVYSLARFDGQTWTQYEVNVRRLLVAPDGSVWGQGWDGRVGSDCCYVHVTGDTWVTYTHSALLPVSQELLGDVHRLKN